MAIAVIEKAITAMGGRAAWGQVGGATAEAVISSKDLPIHTVIWSDDWSTGRIRFRRDTAEGEKSKYSLIGSDTLQIRLLSKGKSEPIQHDNGIVVLAISYPAAALVSSTRFLKFALRLMSSSELGEQMAMTCRSGRFKS